MRKIITSFFILSLSLLIVSCSNPLSSTNQSMGKRGIGRGIDRNGGGANDIVRLKDRRGPMGNFGTGARIGSGNSQRYGSGNINPRFSKLNEEDRQKLNSSMEARRAGDIAKSDSIMLELKAKYPDIFSGSIMNSRRDIIGSGSIKK